MASAALALVDQGVAFDLLFTDMIMPGGMNGRELAEAVLQRRPGIKVLYTSGYTDDAIVHEGHLDPGVVAAQKAVPEIGSGAENPRGVGERLKAAVRGRAMRSQKKRGGIAPAAPQLLNSLVQG